MRSLPGFLAPQPMPAAPLFPGPSSGAEEGWQVTSKGGDFRHVRLFQGFPGVLEMPGGEKGGERRGGIPGGGKMQVKPGKMH